MRSYVLLVIVGGRKYDQPLHADVYVRDLNSNSEAHYPDS